MAMYTAAVSPCGGSVETLLTPLRTIYLESYSGNMHACNLLPEVYHLTTPATHVLEM